MKEIHLTLDADHYRAREGVSASDIKHILPPKTPAHYHAHKSGLIKREETRAFTIGTLCHLAVLEPDLLDTAFAAKPQGLDLRTKEGKAWKLEVGDLPILDEGEVLMLYGMRDNVNAHGEAKKLLAGSQREVSLFADHRSGLVIKGRADILGSGFVADVKTTEAADRQSFALSIHRFNYHVQAAMYCQLASIVGNADISSFKFIVVEKSPPYAVAVYELSPKAMQLGLDALNTALETIAECESNGSWPSYVTDVAAIDLPPWAYKDAEVKR